VARGGERGGVYSASTMEYRFVLFFLRENVRRLKKALATTDLATAPSKRIEEMLATVKGKESVFHCRGDMLHLEGEKVNALTEGRLLWS